MIDQSLNQEPSQVSSQASSQASSQVSSQETGQETGQDSGRGLIPINGTHTWLVLYKAFKAVEGNALRSIEACDMCISDFAVLEVLLHKGPTPINRIAKKVLLTSGSITALVDRLEKRSLLERFDDPADRRIRLVRLTEAGRSLIEKAFAEHEKDLDAAVSALDRDELATLVTLLKKLGYGAQARLTSDLAGAATAKPTEGAK